MRAYWLKFPYDPYMSALTDPRPDPAFLTAALAQEIAGGTSAIIGLNVIITDAAGRVLGSGDRSRVGSFHEASVSVVASRQVESHDAEEAARLVGVLPGTTLPIVHLGAVVGTVGITGIPEQVTRFGQVVKRQTEILLEEAVLLRTGMTRERVLESLLRDLLVYDPDQPADVSARARDFGFDLSLPRRTVVLEVSGSATLDTAFSSPLRLIREVFHGTQDITGSISPVRHVVLQRHDEAAGSGNLAALSALAGRISESVAGTCTIGIGDQVSRPEDFASSYADALRAMRLGPVAGLTSPYDIHDLRLEQLLTSVPASVSGRIVARTIGPLASGRDWGLTRATVIAWVESGFVLVDAAAALSIHRNTLVYRLGRIVEQTGWPTSNRRRWLALYAGCLADALAHAGDQ